MYKKISKVLFVLLFAVISVNSQTNDQNNPNHEKAKTIIKQSQDAIYQKVKRAKIKSILLKTSGVSVIESSTKFDGEQNPRESKINQTTEEDVSLELIDRMNQTVFSYQADKNPVENFTKIETVINGDKFYFNTDTFVNGKRFDMNELLNSPFFPESMKKQMKEAQEKLKNAITKESLQKSIYSRLFPILLDMNWMSDKTFVYIGKAEAGETKADILEIESNTGRQTRYFFDEKTHLLLMITDEISKDGNSSKTTTYFSDYQLMDGLLVAKKVNVETEGSVGNIEMEMMGKKMKASSKSKSVSETIIKGFKINPTFKPDTFAVKEDK